MREVCRWIFSNARSSHISVQCADEVALVDANCSRQRAASLFSDLSHETVTSLLPALFASMGVGAGAIGTIEGVADGVSSIAKLYGGWLTDRIRRRKALCAAGYASMAAATGIIAAATSWPIVMIGRAAAWFSPGIRTPPRKTLLADAVTPQTYGRAFGFERMMDTTGAVLAPLM